MRAHYLQHIPFEGLGSIEAWLKESGYETTSTQFFKSVRVPEPEEVDVLIVMGGPMSVNDEGKYPWLVQEKQFILRFVRTGKPLLGICLGAQLIASAMGARVYANKTKEIGWFPVQGVPSKGVSTFRFPQSVEVFHWHGETFDLPAGAIHLAKSEGCANQAFQYRKSVIGLQFHLETTPELTREIVSNCRNELAPSKYVQSEETIFAAGPEKYRAINSLMAQVLSFLKGTDE